MRESKSFLLSLVKCVCVAFVAVADRRYTYTVCTYYSTTPYYYLLTYVCRLVRGRPL